MTPTRRLALAALGLLLAGAAAAADFPTRPITLVIPFAPGGPTDNMARTLAAAARIGQPVIVENRPGAGGNIGAELVARSAPDGYTVLFGTSGPLAINVALYRKMGYDPIRSFAPVIQIGDLPNVLVVHPSVPAANVKELVAYARANPGKLSYASSGNGASSHLAGVLFNKVAGTDFVHVPYKGTGPALTDLLGGQVAMTFTDVLTAAPYIKAGKLRALGVTTKARSDSLPAVPTIAEQGYPGFDVSVFFGLVVAAGTPRDVVDRLNKGFADALKDPAVRATLVGQGLEFAPSTTPEELARFIRAEVDKWGPVVRGSGVEID